MKRTEICIRDPFVLVHDNRYYLYGTRASQTWGQMDGFDCYVSDDLENWDGPHEIFHKGDDFWADRNYWAPECYEREGKFYLVTTLASETKSQAVYVLEADNPLGPFEFKHQLTPEGECCIDGALYEEDGKLYVVYSHTLQDCLEGAMNARELDPHTLQPIGEGRTLFYANAAPWASPIPFAKAEFGIDGDAYFSDGPCLIRVNGELIMLWSSWGQAGYSVGITRSSNGSIWGQWSHDEKAVIANGGHGMIFADKDSGQKYYAIHSPNDFMQERPVFLEADSIVA